MSVAAALTCVAAFASFGWGVMRFFSKPAGPSPLAIVTAVFGLAFGIAHIHALATTSADAARLAVGLAAHVASTLLFWSAIGACKSPLTAIFERDLPVRLIETGPYKYVRHPFYCAYAIFWSGGSGAAASLLTTLSVPVMLAIYVYGAREEERKFSRSLLAKEYEDYRRRVGAWLPRVTCW
jgi:protein-S-isoprenylcysteine O-methyltransferase Ste14